MTQVITPSRRLGMPRPPVARNAATPTVARDAATPLAGMPRKTHTHAHTYPHISKAL